jgi:hypothetical protein
MAATTTTGVKNALATFEKTIRENNEAGVTSGMYLNNLLAKSKITPNTRSGRGFHPTYARSPSGSTSTTSSNSSAELDEWTSNSSVHSGYTVTERDEDSDSSTESCDSFGEGDEGVDDWEVPSIAADINTNRSRRSLSGRLACSRRPNRKSGCIPETILESNSIGSRQDSNSGHSSKDSRNSSSTHRSSKKSRSFNIDADSDDSETDSFC